MPVLRLYQLNVKMDVMSLGTRLNERLRELDLSQAELSRRAGVAQSLLSAIVRGAVAETRKLPIIAAEIGVRPEWLATGRGPKLVIGGDDEPRMGSTIRQWVPLISWVQAGAFCEAIDLFEPGDAAEWFPLARAVSKHAYVLQVNGDSMTSDSGKSYPSGSYIFVDPEKQPVNGSKVIVKDAEGHVTFKKLSIDGSKTYLVPLNSRYPVSEMSPGMVICGVVVASQDFE